MATQDECRQGFIDTLRKFIDEIEAIDKVTPAQPTEEPSWWVGMMDIQRTASLQLWTLAPEDKPVKKEGE